MNTKTTPDRWIVVVALVSVLGITAWIAAETSAQARQRSYAFSVTDADEEQAYLGVRLREAADEDGARVTSVVEDSPAERAGIAKDDVIVRFDGSDVGGPQELTERIHAAAPGDRVELVVRRDGKTRTLQVELGDRSDLGPTLWYWNPGRAGVEWEGLPEDFEEKIEQLGERLGKQYGEWSERGFRLMPDVLWGRPRLGVQLVETTPELREHLGGDEARGILVSKVLPGTPAEHAGIRVGDLIVEVDGNPVASTSELVDELRERDGETFPVRVVRDGREQSLEVTLPQRDENLPSGPRAGRMAVPQPPPPPIAPLPSPAPRPAMPSAPPLPPVPPDTLDAV